MQLFACHSCSFHWMRMVNQSKKAHWGDLVFASVRDLLWKMLVHSVICWRIISALCKGRTKMACILILNGKVLVAGGCSLTFLASLSQLLLHSSFSVPYICSPSIAQLWPVLPPAFLQGPTIMAAGPNILCGEPWPSLVRSPAVLCQPGAPARSSEGTITRHGEWRCFPCDLYVVW